jgi:hypothetical protein
VEAEKTQYEQGPVSVDGAWFAVVDGEWRQVRHPNPPARSPAPSSMPAGEFEQGPVSVDGAWFAIDDGEWRQVGYVTSRGS